MITLAIISGQNRQAAQVHNVIERSGAVFLSFIRPAWRHLDPFTAIPDKIFTQHRVLQVFAAHVEYMLITAHSRNELPGRGNGAFDLIIRRDQKNRLFEFLHDNPYRLTETRRVP